MALKRVLPGLVIVLVVLLGYSLLTVDISAAYRYGHDNDGDISHGNWGFETTSTNSLDTTSTFSYKSCNLALLFTMHGGP